ncbi:hypothetical protein [Yimella sp. cx-51]|uniref:hypothetical protein n=1 Tax=Yimella sp. cx-51 TaxID=2770551 RepID=UPI001AD88E06|nr:hypothetical protein [Yimella sp. cx-51]QTH38690.1 hypothetical protein J5M86_03325 [Yimella sp. cx-51]
MSIATENPAEVLEGLRRQLRSTESGGRHHPVHPALQPAIGNRLRPGSVYGFLGGTTLGIGLLASASLSESWCGAVGFPHLGLESADEWGVDLQRLILVPKIAPDDWLNAVSTLIEAVDIVMAAAPPPLTPTNRSRLEARLRHRGAVLLVADAWPRATVLRTLSSRWRGLSCGHGHLLGRELTVEAIRGHRSTRATVQWPPLE